MQGRNIIYHFQIFTLLENYNDLNDLNDLNMKGGELMGGVIGPIEKEIIEKSKKEKKNK